MSCEVCVTYAEKLGGRPAVDNALLVLVEQLDRLREPFKEVLLAGRYIRGHLDVVGVYTCRDLVLRQLDDPCAVQAPQNALDLGNDAGVHGLSNGGAARRHEQETDPRVGRGEPGLEVRVEPPPPTVHDEDADLNPRNRRREGRVVQGR